MFDFIVRPLGQLLMLLYDLTGSYGMALLLFAIAVKIVLLPFQMKSKRGMMRQSRLQPKMAEVQKKHGTNKAKVNEEMQKLYKEEGVNPASGCLWGILPLPIMFALFQAIRRPLTMMMNVSQELLEEGGAIYNRLLETGFVPQMQAFYLEMEQATWISAHWNRFSDFVAYGLQEISFYLGPVNLGQQPLWDFFWHETTDWSHVDGWLPGLLLFFIPLVSGGTQFISAAITRKVQPAPAPAAEGAGKSMQTMMMLMPLISVYFGFILPAALGFYWTIGTVLQIFQDLWLNKRYTKILDIEDEERNRLRKIKEAEIESKRLETERKKAEGINEANPNKSKRKKQMTEKQEQLEKAAEWERKHAPPDESETECEPSREGKRRYARGRAYDPARYEAAGVVERTDSDEFDDDEPDASEASSDNNADGEHIELESDIETLEDEAEASEDEPQKPVDDSQGTPNDENPTQTVRFNTARFEEDNKD